LEGDAVTPAPNVSPVVIADPVLTICVQVGDEEMELEPTDDGLQDIFNVLISDPTSAIAIIDKMTDNDSLILLHLAERRVTVKKAARVRAEELQKIEEEQQGSVEEQKENEEEQQESAGDQ